jgi:hypothetical protein
MDENLFVNRVDDTEGLNGPVRGDKDFLESLEKKAAEIEGEAGNSK